MNRDHLGYTLHFVEWQCGHHGQRPADIPVESPEQALLILQAISHAIAQPGSARAVLHNDRCGTEIYITDDYVSGVHSQPHTFELDPACWDDRPTVIHGDDAMLQELLSAELADGRDDVLGWATVDRMQDVAYIDGLGVVTTDAPDVVMAAYLEGLDAYPSRRRFALPPLFRDAAPLLQEVRKSQSDLNDAIEGIPC